MNHSPASDAVDCNVDGNDGIGALVAVTREFGTAGVHGNADVEPPLSGYKTLSFRTALIVTR